MVTGGLTRFRAGGLALLGALAFAAILAFHNITDGDLWGKLALGASVWEKGSLLRHDVFAFTPTLPQYIDHEWGSGVVFYSCLKMSGPGSLQFLKITLALAALGFAILTGRKRGSSADLLLLLAVPAAACLLPGYIPVLRCHAFSFCFFAVTLWLLEALRAGRLWAALALPALILAWANLHGGFVVGLAVIFFDAIIAVVRRRDARLRVGVALACAAATLVNPYGLEFWRYLVPALLHPRARIAEWRPLPLLGRDDFAGFRLFFFLTLAAVAAGWKTAPGNFRDLAVLGLTGYMGWRSRRHGPFFAVAALAYAGPYYAATGAALARTVRLKGGSFWITGTVYAVAAFWVAVKILPQVSTQVLAPIGEDPVRETDILSLAKARGNLASPFGWGSYLAWRLYPRIKISMDGRYETTYPESTFNLNAAFFDRSGDWYALARDYRVDYVVLDLRDSLRPADLIAHGYVLIWQQEGLSALLCLPEHAATLREAARNLPDSTVDPLDLKARGNLY